MSARDELVLLALGRLAAREREALLVRLKSDPALAREAREVARHLALYDALPPTPEPPPFAALESRLGKQRRLDLPWLRWSVAAAALLAVGATLALRGAPEEVAAPAPDLLALLPEQHLLEDGRVRVVLDAGARLRDLPGPQVALDHGRAWFEVQPGPFAVHTPLGSVEVQGTAFEVQVGASLRVEVGEGRVRVREQTLEAGQGLDGGEPYALGGRPGRFARLADLVLDGVQVSEAGIAFVLRFENGAGFARDVPGPEAAATGLLLALDGPAGAVHSLGVDVLAAAAGRLPAAGRLRLAAGERLEIPLKIALPPGPAGTWRLTALYRPQGEAPISSAPVSCEIPPR